MYKITIALRRRGSGGEYVQQDNISKFIYIYISMHICIYMYKERFLDVRRTKLVTKLKIYEHRHLRFLNRQNLIHLV